MTPNMAPLSGAELNDLLNRLEADLEEAASATKIDLLARLRAQPLKADSVNAVERLHSLWMRAGDTPAALAVIDADGAAVIDASPAPQQADARMWLALFRLQIAHHLSDENAARNALDEMRSIAETGSNLEVRRFADLKILPRLWTDMPSVALEAIELRHLLIAKIAGRDEYRAYDQAVRHALRAQAFSRLGQSQEARAAAEAALAEVQQAEPGQSVDSNDWLWLGNALIDIAPHLLPALQQGTAALIRDWLLPHRREVEVRLARLAARARYAEGDLAGALGLCEAARYGLDDGGVSDDFIEYELPWLIEAGRFDEAGQRAFFHVNGLMVDSRELVVSIINAQLANSDDRSVWWPLCILTSCADPATLSRIAMLDSMSTEQIIARSPIHAEIFAAMGKPKTDSSGIEIGDAARKVAQSRAPDHPRLARLAAWLDRMADRIDEATRLERVAAAISAGDPQDSRSAVIVLLNQVHLKGINAALTAPTPSLPSGLWAYNFGCSLDDELEKELEALSDPQREKANTDLNRIVTEAYEQGRRCFEQYFATGRGHPYDAHPHTYSMLCNNLAIRYRYQGKHEEALDLHRRGIETSPFSEHYDGIFWNNITLKNDGATIDAAEELWHFATEYGHSRYDINATVDYTTQALRRLSRLSEMPIWLERLVKWQREEDQEDESELSDLALKVRVRVSARMASAHPDMARAVFTTLRPQ